MTISLETDSPEETAAAGAALARLLRPGDVLALTGELGAGKTVFVQGVAAGLGCDPAVPVTSPTFVIMHEYPGPTPLFHFDFYRLAREEDALEVGCEEFFEADGVCAVEWGEKFPRIFPEAALRVRFAWLSEERRRIELEPGPGFADRAAALREAWRGEGSKILHR